MAWASPTCRPHSTSTRLRDRIQRIEDRLERSATSLLDSQGVDIIRGTGRLAGPRTRSSPTPPMASIEIHADVILLSTGSRPRIPEWAEVDGVRMLTTRDAYPPPRAAASTWWSSGPGSPGVEFVHMFSAFGCEVTLIVSRQQVLPA